jgi:6,7-dimethyl-8-ribityllumazine synthase
MLKAEQGKFNPFNANEWRVAIVVAQFNYSITNSLMESALNRAEAYNLTRDKIDIHKVAGAIELPLVLKSLAESKKYDALLAIGCVIEGDTPHFKYVCKYVTEGILSVQMESNSPIGFGVLTCASEEQARARMNLGGDHLDAVLQQAYLLKNLSSNL